MTTRRTLLALAAAAGMLTALPARAAEDPVYATLLGTAINGYDAVAYHNEGRPVEGSAEFTFEWEGATWRFASAANRDLFAADPARWAPQYGGYCAWAVSNGYTASTDPNAWDVVDGRLFLNYSLDVRERWRQDRAARIVAADANWPGVLE